MPHLGRAPACAATVILSQPGIAREFKRVITERGFGPEVRVGGPVAVVYPYDLYIDDNWSHCAVDIFTLIKRADGWRVVTMAWGAEQPPVCERHPDGPPRR